VLYKSTYLETDRRTGDSIQRLLKSFIVRHWRVHCETCFAVDCFGSCLTDVEAWLRASRLRLNPTKTQVMWLGSSQQLAKLDITHVCVPSSCVVVQDTARDLGVVIDSQLSLSAHVTAVCQSGYLPAAPAIRLSGYPVAV